MSNLEPTIEAGISVENHRTRQRRLLVGIVASCALVVGGVMIVSSAVSTQPTSVRVCGAAEIESGCVVSRPLDLSSIELYDAIPRGFDISPDTRSVLVSFDGNSVDSDTGPEDRLVVAEFDTSSGQVRRVLIDVVGRAGQVASGAVAYSPDGALAVASTEFESSGRLDLFDVETGVSVATIGSVSDSPCRDVGVAPDRRLVQCDDVVRSIADGAQVEGSDGLARYLDAPGISRTGLLADFRPVENSTDTIIEISSHPSGEVIARFDREHTEQQRRIGTLNFDPSGRFVLDDFTTGPSQPSAVTRFVLYDVDTGRAVWTSQLGFNRWDLAWNENGALGALSLDLEVVVYRPSPLR